MNQKTRDDGTLMRDTTGAAAGGRRSYYAGAIAPVRLGARRHQSAHGAQIIHVQPIRLSTTSRPNGE